MEEETTMTSDSNHAEDAFGVRWPNAETEIVHSYLANKTHVMLEMREAARTYFHSPYRVWNEMVPMNEPAEGQSFADYAKVVITRATNDSDPGHDADRTLQARLIACSLNRVDWEAIAAWWRAAVITECDIHSSAL
jgi:hypothetical protein